MYSAQSWRGVSGVCIGPLRGLTAFNRNKSLTMCDKCDPTTSYASAYAASQSVSIRVDTFCPKCLGGERLTVESHIHFGGESWEPWLSCPKCGWGIIVGIHPGRLNGIRI